jgi:hypothetical protein
MAVQVKKLGLIKNWANIFLLDTNWREIWVLRKILLHTVVVVVVVVVVMREMVFPWKKMMKAAKFDSDRPQNLPMIIRVVLLRPYADGALCHTGLATLGIGFPDAGRTSAL